MVWDRSVLHAEVLAYVRDLLERAGIAHQPATWGKSQTQASGGPRLPFLRQLGINGLDVSMPLPLKARLPGGHLDMHKRLSYQRWISR